MWYLETKPSPTQLAKQQSITSWDIQFEVYGKFHFQKKNVTDISPSETSVYTAFFDKQAKHKNVRNICLIQYQHQQQKSLLQTTLVKWLKVEKQTS